MLIYLGFAVLIGVPGRAIIALTIVGPAAWWCFDRYSAWMKPRTSKLSFFTWDNGPLRLSEDICSSKIVYCVGVRNEGTKVAGSVCVNIQSVEGCARPTSGASLPIFRSPDNSVSLQPDESEYFCVMRRIGGASVLDGKVALCCHNNLVTPSIGIQELVHGRIIALSAHSEGAHRITGKIQISSKRETDATWSLHMMLLPAADETSVQTLEQRRMAADPHQVREAWNWVGTKLSELGELCFGQRDKKGIACVASARRELPLGPSEDAATQGERIAPKVQAVDGVSLNEEATFGGITKESPPQSERIRRLLARQARA
jgi:hypothetical protein